ncbi:serine/threonine-protein phosphatase 2 [Peptococcaceae bacterium CEB3]|nr:serine/threonine-protein phosphatase 2 [Peptococcaceae bacterium CEB3]
MSKNRFLAISDIHGCADLLVAVLEQAQYQPHSDQLILLGDYIDRGSQSYETVQIVKSLVRDGAIALLGNHEDMAIQAIESDGIEQWFANGGRYTIRSYTQNHTFVEDDIGFFKSLPLYHETEDYIFVHAGLNPDYPRPETSDRDTLLWIREDWLRCEYVGKLVVFGHTPARSVT